MCQLLTAGVERKLRNHRNNMSHRATHIIALIGYLTSLLVTVSHAHASGAAEGNWQSHVHLSSDCDHSHSHAGGCEHDYDHDCNGYSHTHADQTHSPDHSESHSDASADQDRQPAAAVVNCGNTHDTDAVYFTTVDQAPCQQEHKSSLNLEHSPFDLIAVLLVDFTTGFAFGDIATNDLAGNVFPPACARYLTLCTLRI
jgi:hypothetical protein